MLIALRHEQHGTHLAYSEAEAVECEKNGWKRDPEWSEVMKGARPVEAKRKPGRPPKQAEA